MKSARLTLLLLGAACLGFAQNQHWIGSWGASPARQIDDPAAMLAGKLLYENQTVRQIAHLSAGGRAIRIRLSNAYGHRPVTIGAVHLALQQSGCDIVASSDHAVTFGGSTSVTLPPGALVLSDPIDMNVPALSDIAVSLYLPKPTAAAGIHYSAQQTAYIGAGDQTASATFQKSAEFGSWVFFDGLDVLSDSPTAGAIVAFGDSITDGAWATVDANHRWPNYLADRLARKRIDLGVLDEGIGGNRILHDGTDIRFGVAALARFDRDVLAQAGVRYVIVLEGINDIGHPGSGAPMNEKVSAEDIIGGYKQMIARAHEKNIRIFGATLTPFTGTTIQNYYSPEKERIREAVNQWIRTSNSFDGVIDFDKAVQDPAHPDQMLPAYDSGDHLHPRDPGYKAMADSIDLSLFE